MNDTRKFVNRVKIRAHHTIRGAFALSFMLLFYFQTWATEPHNPVIGSELYVTAQSGLHMRTSPNALASSIKIIPLGETVQVIDQLDSIVEAKIDWVKGQWLLVEHEGDTGYLFDGFLSSLAVPKYSWEKCQLDLDMIYPLEQWTETNHLVSTTDTVEGEYISKVSQYFTNGNKLVKINSGNIYKIELTLCDIRIMDAYHLLQNMVEDKPGLRTFHNQSIFIEEADSADLKKIKVKLEDPIEIRKLRDGKIKISIHSQEYPCQL